LIFDLAAVAVAFVVAAVAYPFLIRAFRRLRLGQIVQAELSQAHQRKAGTPTGGGILFVGLGLIGGLLSLRMHPGAAPALAALLLFGGLGLLDDLRKLRVGSLGIPARLKFPIQLAFAIPVAALAHQSANPAKSHKCTPHEVAYTASGTFVSWAATQANMKIRAAGFCAAMSA